MSFLVGIDLGTSSLKAVVMSESGEVVAQAGRSYGISSPQDGFMEQDPDMWWSVCCEALRECIPALPTGKAGITGVGFSGQMHGLVLLDREKRPLCPAILHCDRRSYRQTTYITEKLAGSPIMERLLNPIFSGFQLTSLCWIQQNRPELYEKARYILAPKDYLRLKMTGEICTDASDAAATLLYDVKNLCWCDDLLDLLGIAKGLLPPVVGTTDAAGFVTKEAALQTGLPANTVVGAGGGDQVMQAIGNGVVFPGSATVNIGTSGQIFIPSDAPVFNKALNTHTFCGAQRGLWYIMGAMLSAGISLKWFRSLVMGQSFSDLDNLAMHVPPGSGGLLFLPYLNGERTPHMDQDLSGAFLGMGLQTSVGEMASAVMEGVAYALRECLETCLAFVPEPQRFIASGGGAHSSRWLQIQADILERPLYVSEIREQAAVGAAIAAGVASGSYRDLPQGCGAVVRYREEPTLPIAAHAEVYREYYGLFLAAYRANAGLLASLTRIRRAENDA